MGQNDEYLGTEGVSRPGCFERQGQRLFWLGLGQVGEGVPASKASWALVMEVMLMVMVMVERRNERGGREYRHPPAG